MDVGRANDQRTIAVCILGQDSGFAVGDRYRQRRNRNRPRPPRLVTAWRCRCGSTPLSVSTDRSRKRCTSLDLVPNSPRSPTSSTRPCRFRSWPPMTRSWPLPAVRRRRACGRSITCGGVDRSGFASQARTLTAVAAVAVISLFTLSSAGSPVTLAQRSVARPAPPAAAQPAELPARCCTATRTARDVPPAPHRRLSR